MGGEWTEQLFGHACSRDRRDDVGLDAGARAFNGKHVGKPDQAHLGGAVI